MNYNAVLKPELADSLTPGERYRFAVREVVRQGEVWGLWDGDNWAVFADRQGRECSPVWPGEEFALGWTRPELAGFIPRRMELDCWLDRWLTMQVNNGRMVAVFPAGADDGFVASPASLLFDVMDELVAYE